MDSSKTVLLIDIREPIRDLLCPMLEDRGFQPLIVSLRDFRAADYEFECGDVPASGWIRFPEQEDPLWLHSIAGSLAGQPRLDIDNDSISQFKSHELMAFVAFVRQTAGLALNPPNTDMISTDCGSLPEQWETLRSMAIGARAPSWRLGGPANPGIENDEVAVHDIMNPRLRTENDDSELTSKPLLVQEPRGIFSSCAFVGKKQHHLRVSEDGIEPVEVLPDTYDRFSELILALRRIYPIDFGEIAYAYLGDVLFWSVTPFLSVEHARHDTFQPLSEHLIEQFTT